MTLSSMLHDDHFYSDDRLQISGELNSVADCTQVVDHKQHMSIGPSVRLDVGIDLINDRLRLRLCLRELYLDRKRQFGHNKIWYHFLDRHLHPTNLTIVVEAFSKTAAD